MRSIHARFFLVVPPGRPYERTFPRFSLIGHPMRIGTDESGPSILLETPSWVRLGFSNCSPDGSLFVSLISRWGGELWSRFLFGHTGVVGDVTRVGPDGHGVHRCVERQEQTETIRSGWGRGLAMATTADGGGCCGHGGDGDGERKRRRRGIGTGCCKLESSTNVQWT